MIKKIWLNAQFYLFFILFTVLYTPPMTAVVLLTRLFAGVRVALKVFRYIISFYGKIIIWVLPRPWIKVRFTDCEPGLKPPYIVVCNHRAASDAFLMAVLKHETVQVVNKWPFRLPLLGLMAKLSGYLSVNEMPYEEFSVRVKKLLAAGVCVAAFPEGTRSGTKEVGQFYSSIFRIALETGVPVVPVAICGNEDKPAKGNLWLNTGTIQVEKLPAVMPQGFNGYNAFKFKNYIRDKMINEIERIEQQ